MSLEAIQTVTQVEKESQEKLSAAEAEAKALVEKAGQDGEALLRRVRSEAAEAGKERMRQAEERAAKQAEKIAAQAKAESDALYQSAEKRLEQAADLIVGKVVKR